MGDIGEDIKEVLSEVGTPITIYKLSGATVTGEYIDAENYYKHSTDFIRQNVWTCDTQYDSQIEDGDILDMAGTYVLVMNYKPTKFEQDVVIGNAFLVETNCVGKFARKSVSRDAITMEETVTWTDTNTGVRAVQTEHIRNPSFELSGDVEQSAIRELLYIQKLDDIRIGDRWYPDEEVLTEYYRVINISSRIYAGLYRLNLEADTRI
jgi:hypothetical protein